MPAQHLIAAPPARQEEHPTAGALPGENTGGVWPSTAKKHPTRKTTATATGIAIDAMRPCRDRLYPTNSASSTNGVVVAPQTSAQRVGLDRPIVRFATEVPKRAGCAHNCSDTRPIWPIAADPKPK